MQPPKQYQYIGIIGIATPVKGDYTGLLAQLANGPLFPVAVTLLQQDFTAMLLSTFLGCNTMFNKVGIILR